MFLTQRPRRKFYFVLYDVTTLYFESFKADEFKTRGFLKDNKSQQPQIVIGLLVTQSGFPLLSQVFAGNTFEGKTMIPVLEAFISTHPQTRPIIVADAAMLDDERLTELRQRRLSYIVGARLPNAKQLTLVKRIHASLNGKDLCKALHKFFRMSKFDLQARPIYYQKHDAIKAHVLICFVALMAEKYLEPTTRLSLREIRYLTWDITETQIQDILTREIFSFRSPTKVILASKLAALKSKWNLLPH